MAEYTRKHPCFSLCGLNCCLCPRYHTDGSSKCPGCGGIDFSLKHPSCAVITCNKKHDNVEFCFDCSSYPCKKYQEPSKADSFITYKNVLQDQADAKTNLLNYLNTLEKKRDILSELIANYNDGKSKGFYCMAVNLLPLSMLEEIWEKIKSGNMQNTREITEMMKQKASTIDIELTLRK